MASNASCAVLSPNFLLVHLALVLPGLRLMIVRQSYFQPSAFLWEVSLSTFSARWSLTAALCYLSPPSIRSRITTLVLPPLWKQAIFEKVNSPCRSVPSCTPQTSPTLCWSDVQALYRGLRRDRATGPSTECCLLGSSNLRIHGIMNVVVQRCIHWFAQSSIQKADSLNY